MSFHESLHVNTNENPKFLIFEFKILIFKYYLGQHEFIWRERLVHIGVIFLSKNDSTCKDGSNREGIQVRRDLK